MNERIDIQLLEEDFQNSYYMDSRDCPLARAARRHFNAETVSTSMGSLTNHDTKDNYRPEDVIFNGEKIADIWHHQPYIKVTEAIDRGKFQSLVVKLKQK